MSITTPHASEGSYLMPSLWNATVADAMHPGILSCEPGATLADVARMMASRHVHCVIVTGISQEARSEKLVWGVISDLDLVRVGIRTGPDEFASALAHHPVVTVELDMPLRQAGELMLSKGVSHLVVIDSQQRPVGILSTLDIAGVLAWGEA